MKQFDIKAAGLAVTIGLLGLTGGPAYAGCSDGVAPAKEHSSAPFVPAVYHPAFASAAFMTVSDQLIESSAIVGLWEFEVHLNGAQNGLPDQALFDWGLATWHDDGTEIQFSAGRPPSAGDVCMGVWRQVGKHQFKLHHVALGLTPPGSDRHFRWTCHHPRNGDRGWRRGQLYGTLLDQHLPGFARRWN